MKNAVQQEILLMANSSLSKKSFCEKDPSENSQSSSNMEQLAEACWNGMLDEFLPGLVLHQEGKTLFMWEIQTAKSFLHIDLCDQVPSHDKQNSIDPYIFINQMNLN